MSQALQNAGQQQLGFFARRPTVDARTDRPASTRARTARPLCAGCRAKEARYGFRRHDDDPGMERPRTLCFECFRIELAYRQAVVEQRARGWNATQTALPLEETLNELHLRRRRAQIAARRALGI